MTTPTQILRETVRIDAARPRITWYDQETGERVELSGTSLINWVDKTAHLLAGELGALAGSSVAIDLPRHWLTAVWWLAADAVGATPGLGPDAGADVAVFGPAGLDALPPGDELVAVSLRPMGAAFDRPLPPLVRDYTLEVRAAPDHFSPTATGDHRSGQRASDLAATWGLGPTDRVASAGPWRPESGPVAALLAPLAAGGSTVWLRNPADPESVSLLATEGVTAWLGDPPRGSVLPPAIRLLGQPSVS